MLFASPCLIKGEPTVNRILNFKATLMREVRNIECHVASLLELPGLSGFLEGSDLCEGKCCRTAIALEQGQSAVEPILEVGLSSTHQAAAMQHHEECK